MGAQRLPGGGPSAHLDRFVLERLPPPALLPEMAYGALPELAAYPDRINCAAALLDAHVAAGRGGRTALLAGERRWSYAALADLSDRIAQVLTEDLGLVPGERVLLRAPNNPMLVACWFAVAKAGGVVVATMPMLRARELETLIDRARIRLALCDARLLDELTAAQARATHRLERVLSFTAAGDGDAELDRAAAAKPGGFQAVDTAADDPALIAFTSGTTGQPKGTVHLHRDVLAICDCFPKHVYGMRPDDLVTGSPPLAFTFGLGALALFPFRVGAAALLLERFDPETLLAAIARHRVTGLFTAPTAYRAMADLVHRFDLASLRRCVSAGEHLPRATFELWRERTGISIIDGLGATEMLHIFIAAADDGIRPGATGRPIPGYQATILDEDGREAPPDVAGRLAVKGPTGCRYLDDPERQARYVRDGWNLTGDIYRRDAEGWFWHVGRADDMIVTAGYNVSGPEVEAALLEHPAVRECAVIGAPDPERGQIVKAFVVPAEGAAPGPDLAKALQDHVKAVIAPYKYPRAVAFVAELPKTPTGKLQRFALRLREAEQAGERP